MHDEIVVAAWQTFLSIFFKKAKLSAPAHEPCWSFFCMIYFLPIPPPPSSYEIFFSSLMTGNSQARHAAKMWWEKNFLRKSKKIPKIWRTFCLLCFLWRQKNTAESLTKAYVIVNWVAHWNLNKLKILHDSDASHWEIQKIINDWNLATTSTCWNFALHENKSFLRWMQCVKTIKSNDLRSPLVNFICIRLRPLSFMNNPEE